MRQKRAKTYKRVMALYVQTFNFRQPFQVLVSDDILVMPAAQQLDIVKLLSTCVQAEIKPMITQCCVEALYALGPSHQRTTNLAKTLERRRCNHRTALPSDECLADVIGTSNKHRYVLAAQSAELREKMDRIPGVPVIHFNGRGVAVLSPPGVATVREKVKGEEERRLGDKAAEEGMEDGANVIGAKAGIVAGPSGRGRKGANPNPLSMRKKKAPVAPEGPKAEGSKEKKRDRNEDEEGDAEEDEEKRTEAVREGEEAGGAGRKKKKRKRRGKGEVALAIEELNATGLGGVKPIATGGDESGGEGGESD